MFGHLSVPVSSRVQLPLTVYSVASQGGRGQVGQVRWGVAPTKVAGLSLSTSVHPPLLQATTQ